MAGAPAGPGVPDGCGVGAEAACCPGAALVEPFAAAPELSGAERAGEAGDSPMLAI
ncbi:hypothetical protein [Leucobacter luti]|uniref:hypothetical protein n=1 Tax=Leucobacter luti TaxID=340320 RepID=UPI001C691835|nr:hypothetical protein [Leucobacter luti]QYM77120.1 hypothetical protein K1X41_07090 [Leucobacter luti]